MKAAALHALAATLIANGAELTAANFDIAELEKMSDTTRQALGAALKALEKSQAKAAAEDDAAKEKEKAMKANAEAAAKAAAEAAAAAGKPITLGQLNTMVADAVKAAVGEALKPEALASITKRAEIEGRLLANQACAFTAAELKTMSFEALDKYERSIRPADYSGAGPGAFQTHAAASGSPLLPGSGLFVAKSEQKTQ